MSSPPLLDRRLETQALTLGGALGLIGFVVWAWLAGPTSWLLDSGEFVATTWSLGISHPPGHPSYLLTSRAFTIPALGGIAWRVHLASAAAAAVAIAALPVAAVRLGLVRDRAGLIASAVMAGIAASSFAFTFQAVRAEVYALNVAAIAVSIACIARPAGAPTDLRRVALGAVALGVGLGNHHYLTVFAFPAVLIAVLGAADTTRDRLRAVGIGIVAGAATQLSWLALVATSQARAWPSWPWATDGSSLWWLVSAQAFQKSASNVTRVDPAAGLENVVTVLIDQLTPLGLILVAAGLAIAASRARRAVAVLVPLVALNLVTQSLFDFDPLNPDVYGYFMVAVWGAALLAVAPFGLIRSPRLVHAGLAIAAVAALASRIAIPPLAPLSLARDYESETWRDSRLVGIGPDGVLVTGHFETGFDQWYAIAVEDRRPDLLHVHRPWRTWPGFDAMLAEASPAAAELLDDRADEGGVDLDVLQAWSADGRDVRIEPDILMTVPEAAASDPEGLTRRVRPPGALPVPTAVALSRARFDALAARLGDMRRESRQSLLWASVQAGRAQALTGDAAGALRLLEPARAIAPDDPDLRALVDALSGRGTGASTPE